MGIGDRLVDLEREGMFGRLLPKEFLEALGDHLPEIVPGREERTLSEITARIEPIIADNTDVFDDEAGDDLLRACATVLAAYQVLKPEIDEEHTLAVLRHVFTHFGARTTRFATRVLMSLPGDTLGVVERYFRATEPMLGDSWSVEWDPAGDSFGMTFTECGFHRFFSRNEAPRVTTVFCAWDESWIKAIDPERDQVEATRPSTIGYGAKSCEFRFARIRQRDPG